MVQLGALVPVRVAVRGTDTCYSIIAIQVKIKADSTQPPTCGHHAVARGQQGETSASGNCMQRMQRGTTCTHACMHACNCRASTTPGYPLRHGPRAPHTATGHPSRHTHRVAYNPHGSLPLPLHSQPSNTAVTGTSVLGTENIGAINESPHTAAWRAHHS